jgi:hypothetical protein
MKYAVEMDSGATIYIPIFIKICSGFQKLVRGIHIEIRRQQGDLISLLLFVQNKESRRRKITTLQLVLLFMLLQF